MNANTQTAPALEDGWWYWVRYDIGFGADAIEAPARYRAQIDCFYSHQFSGIPARECEVLGPALRSPPADLTFDALLKRIKESPLRDDMALASLLVSQTEEIKALRNAVLEEREACAKVCEGRRGGALQTNDWWDGFKTAAKQIAAGIRARGRA